MNEPSKPAQGTPGIPGYKIVGKLGSGGMGVVYKAIQVSMNRPVALKVLYARHAKDSEFLERFRREISTLAKLSHPNIVIAIDTGLAGDSPFYAMEYVQGATVTDIVKKSGPIPEPRCLDIALQIARALAHAARHKLIHRDIKPDNIIVTDEGTAKLLDLGIAKSLEEGQESSLTTEGVAIGTPAYISPEQAQGLPADERSDIYSLGVTLYYMSTARVPFGGPTAASVLRAHLTVTPPPPEQYNPKLSRAFSGLIIKMLAKEPDDRYRSAAELIQDIERISKGGGTPAKRRLAEVEAPSAQAARFIKPALIAAVLLLAGALGVLFYVSKFQKQPVATRPSGPRPPSPPSTAGPTSPPDPGPEKRTTPDHGKAPVVEDERIILQQEWIRLEAALKSRTRDEATADLLASWFSLISAVSQVEPALASDFLERAKAQVRAIAPAETLAEVDRLAADQEAWETAQERALDWSARIDYLLWVGSLQPRLLAVEKSALSASQEKLAKILSRQARFNLSLNVFPLRSRLVRLQKPGIVLVDGGMGRGSLEGWGGGELEMPVGVNGLEIGPWEIEISDSGKSLKTVLDPARIRRGGRVNVWGDFGNGNLEVSYE